MDSEILIRRMNQIQTRIGNSIDQINDTLDSIIMTMYETNDEIEVIVKLEKVMKIWESKCSELK